MTKYYNASRDEGDEPEEQQRNRSFQYRGWSGGRVACHRWNRSPHRSSETRSYPLTFLREAFSLINSL